MVTKGILDARAEKLNNTNWYFWKQTVILELKVRGLWKDVELPLPESPTEVQKQSDEKARLVILQLLEREQFDKVSSATTAYELFSKLQENHEGAAAMRKDQASQDFHYFKQKKGETIVETIGRFGLIMSRLKASGYQLEETSKFHIFRGSVSEDWTQFIDFWKLANKDGKFEELASAIKIQEISNKSKKGKEKEKESVAFLSTSNSKKKKVFKDKSTQTDSPATSEVSCNYCKLKGHMWRNCFKLKDKMKEENPKQKPEQKFIKAQKEKKEDVEKSSVAFMANTPDSHVEHKEFRWVGDSAATRHMTFNKEYLSNYSEFGKKCPIITAGKNSFAIGSGDFFFEANGVKGCLKDVWLVPGIPYNLLSTNKAQKAGYSIIADGKDQKVTIVKETEVFLEGRRYEDNLDLILFDLKPSRKTTESVFIGAPLPEWHKRFGHVSDDMLKKILTKNVVRNLEVSDTKCQCTSCALGKSKRSSHPVTNEVKGSENSAVIHFDTAGPMQTQSLGGNVYLVVAVEDYSNYKIVELAKNKKEIKNIVKKVVNFVELTSRRRVLAVKSDNGSEYVNEDLKSWLDNRGILHVKSAPYCPQQNGVAERAIGVITTIARTLLIDSGLPKYLWAEACKTAAYAHNMTLGPRSEDKTRFEMFHGYKPDVSNLRVFGQSVVIRDESGANEKFAAKGINVKFVGYTNRFNTFRFYNGTKVIVSCDVKFLNKNLEETVDKKVVNYTERIIDIPDKNENSDEEELEDWKSVSDDIDHEYETIGNEGETGADQSVNMEIDENVESNSAQQQGPLTINDAIHEEINVRNGANEVNRVVTRSQGEPLFSGLRNVGRALMASEIKEEDDLFSLDDEPRTLKEAKEREDWPEWRKAINAEFEALDKNNTFDLVDKTQNQRVIGSRWVLRVKRRNDNTIERYKARLVAKGYSQIEGIDFKQTFAPVASMIYVRLFFAIIVQQSLVFTQFDVATAFLNGDLSEQIYMSLPEGLLPGQVCKLKKSIYGLKQAPRNWNFKFRSFLEQFGFKNSNSDQCFYYNTERKIYLIIYVDDALVAARTQQELDLLIKFLKRNLEVKVLDCKNFLGFQIVQRGREIVLHQKGFIERILKKFRMEDAKESITPQDTGAFDPSNSPPYPNITFFRQLVGSLLYLSTCTRPDISFTVGTASRTSVPTDSHISLLKKTLRYLKGTADWGIGFNKSHGSKLVGYSDSDYANDPITRKSITGWIILIGSPIAWASRQQRVVTKSSTEAEYMAASDLVSELLPVKHTLQEVGLANNEPTPIMIDNRSTILLATNTSSRQKTKHIDVRAKWLTQHQESGVVKAEYVPTEEQVADFLTKPLTGPKFSVNRAKVMTCLGMLLILAVLSTGEAFSFSPIQPVFYEAKDLHYFSEHQDYNLTMRIVNPCEIFFKDITSNATVNEKLVFHCKSEFSNRTINSFKVCKDVRAGKQVDDNIISRLSNSLLSRKKRNPVVALVVYSVMAGVHAYTIIEQQNTISNADEQARFSLETRKIQSEAINQLNQTRNTIQRLDDKLAMLEKRIDFVDSKVESYNQISSLIVEYLIRFSEYGEVIAELDQQVEFGKIPSKFQSLLKTQIWDNKVVKWSQVRSCTFDTDHGNDLLLNLQFSIPTEDTQVKIFEAVAFRFWKKEQDKYCFMKYHGPQFVLANITNNCFLDILRFWIHNDVIQGQPCLEQNGVLDERLSVYTTDVCLSTLPRLSRSVQVKTVDGFQKIYCYGVNITIRGEEMACPNFVFEVPVAETYVLNQVVHKGRKVSRSVDALDIQINRDIFKQLKLDERKVYGTNLTSYNAGFTVLDEMVRNMTSLTLTKLKVSEVLTTPTLALKEFLTATWQRIKSLGQVIALLLLAILCLATAPLFHILLGLVKGIRNLIVRKKKLTKTHRSDESMCLKLSEL